MVFASNTLLACLWFILMLCAFPAVHYSVLLFIRIRVGNQFGSAPWSLVMPWVGKSLSALFVCGLMAWFIYGEAFAVSMGTDGVVAHYVWPRRQQTILFRDIKAVKVEHLRGKRCRLVIISTQDMFRGPVIFDPDGLTTWTDKIKGALH